MKDLFDRLAGLRPPNELGWVGTICAVLLAVCVLLVLVFLAMAVAEADVEVGPPKCSIEELVVTDGELRADCTIDTFIQCRWQQGVAHGVTPVKGCTPKVAT